MSTYQGKATVVGVEASDLKEYMKKDLSEEQVEVSFMLDITVQPLDKSFGEAHIEVEISERECEGKMAGRIQKDISLEQLFKQHLISAAKIENLEEVFESAGKEVEIYQKERQYKANDGTMKTGVNTYFSSFQRLSKAVIASRLAMLSGKKPTGAQAPAKSANPFD